MSYNLIKILSCTEKKPIDSWITGWVYLYYRTRVEDIGITLGFMHNHHDAYARVNAFKELINKGEWNLGSFNVTLFKGLVKKIPEYAALDDRNASSYSLRLKELIAPKIDSFIARYEAEQLEIKREKEREAAEQKRLDELADNVSILDNLDDAKSEAQDNPNRAVFCFARDNKWKTYLIDATGKEFPLDLHPLCVEKFVALTAADSTESGARELRSIKHECIKVKEQLLAKVQLLINPEDTDEEIINQRTFSTFVLRHTAEKSQLSWITSLGKVKEISLEKYPQLSAWLKKHSSIVNNEDVLHLKTYLLQVDPMKELDKERLNAFGALFKQTFTSTTEQPPAPIVKVLKKERSTQKDGLFKDDVFRKQLESIMLRGLAQKESVANREVESTKMEQKPSAEAVAPMPGRAMEKLECIERPVPGKLKREHYIPLNGLFGQWDKKAKEKEGAAKLDAFTLSMSSAP